MTNLEHLSMQQRWQFFRDSVLPRITQGLERHGVHVAEAFILGAGAMRTSDTDQTLSIGLFMVFTSQALRHARHNEDYCSVVGFLLGAGFSILQRNNSVAEESTTPIFSMG